MSKAILLYSLSLFVSSIGSAIAAPVIVENQWQESYSVSTARPNLIIDNIWGDIIVRAGGDNTVDITFTERRSAPNQNLLDRSYETLPLHKMIDSEDMHFVVGYRNEWNSRNFQSRNAQPRNLQPRKNLQCRKCRAEYRFEVTVPANTNLDLGTVNSSSILVTGIQGKVSARNINGPIDLNNIRNCEYINSINGAIDLVFQQAPTENCKIKTLNGDITTWLPQSANLDLAFNTFGGKIRSAFEIKPFSLPIKVEKQQDGDRHIYRLENTTGLRIGTGGTLFNISSRHGNIDIKKLTH